ncbi:unnamed protein product [Closterium sp. NIES-64]|nr:unnamed protein product [Closterium sp. NIES-64]
MASAKGVLRNVQAQEEASPHSPRKGGFLRNDELARQLEQLKDIDALQAQVQAEVATHHDDLLQQLSSLKDTEGVLSVVRAGVDSLLASVQRVRAEIADPYRAIQVKTRQLAALYDTMELLRAVIKYLKLVRKLWEHLNVGVEKAELGKAGQVWQETSQIPPSLPHPLLSPPGAQAEGAPGCGGREGGAGEGRAGVAGGGAEMSQNPLTTPPPSSLISPGPMYLPPQVRKLQEHLNGGVEKAELGKAGQVWQDVGTQMSPFPLNPLLSPPQVRKLREHLAAGVEKAELSKAGQVWQEVGAVHREAQLGGVHVVEAQHEWVAEAGQAIRREAMKALEGGMEAMNQAEVGSVLQAIRREAMRALEGAMEAMNQAEVGSVLQVRGAAGVNKGQTFRREAMRALEGGMEAMNQAEVGSVLQVRGAAGERVAHWVVEAQQEWVVEAGQAIRREAMKAQEGGMEAMNQAEVGELAAEAMRGDGPIASHPSPSIEAMRGDGPITSMLQTVDQLVAKHKGQAMRAVATGLDMKAISASMGASGGGGGLGGSVGGPGGAMGAMRSGTPPMGGAPRAREALWQRLTGCLDELARVMVLTWHLQRVMAKKRDPISHVVFLDHVLQVGGGGWWLEERGRGGLAGDALPTERVWEALLRAFSSQLRATFTASSFVKETFSGDALPTERVWEALLRAFSSQLRATFTASSFVKETFTCVCWGEGEAELVEEEREEREEEGLGWERLEAVLWQVRGPMAALPAVISVEHRAQMMAALEPFQAAYLALSLSRMTDPINTMMPAAGGGRGGVPGPEAG